MESLISLVIVFIVAVSAIFLALSAGRPAVDAAKASAQITDTQNAMKTIGNYIDEVSSEGNGSSRTYTLAGQKIEFQSGENVVMTELDAFPSLFDFGTRVRSGGLTYIAGSDVSCYQDNNTMTIENTFVRFVFNKTRSGPIDTARMIEKMTLKPENLEVVIANSSVMIDSDPQTSTGTGYSELLGSGSGLPLCTAHFHISSSTTYDVYYRLYAYADFISARVVLAKY